MPNIIALSGRLALALSAVLALSLAAPTEAAERFGAVPLNPHLNDILLKYPPPGCYGAPMRSPPAGYLPGCQPPPQWINACANKYKTFNSRNGYYYQVFNHLWSVCIR